MSSSLFNNSINYYKDHNELLNVLQSLSDGDGDFLMNLTGDEVFQNGNTGLIDGSDLSNSIDKNSLLLKEITNKTPSEAKKFKKSLDKENSVIRDNSDLSDQINSSDDAKTSIQRCSHESTEFTDSSSIKTKPISGIRKKIENYAFIENAEERRITKYKRRLGLIKKVINIFRN